MRWLAFEMATLPIPTQITPSSSQLSPDQLTIILASITCLVFFVVIIVLLSILYQRDPFCCKMRTSHQYPDTLPQYYGSRQTLVGSPCNGQDSEMAYDNAVTQPGQLFLIGQPNNYHLHPLETPLPNLPSYESVRKKDRQRQIHMMIADQFDLHNTTVVDESPPTYEESVCRAVEDTSNRFGVTDTASTTVVDLHPSALSTEVREVITDTLCFRCQLGPFVCVDP